MKEFLTFCLLAFFSTLCYSQTKSGSFFTDFSLSHNYKTTEKWSHTADINYKHFYSHTGWNRAGLTFDSRRKLGIWAVDLGLLSNLTYDREIENYFEIRPNVALNLKTPVVKNLDFNQKLKFEWRNLIFAEDSQNDSSTRVRYRISPNYKFDNQENKNNWSTHLDLEWYFISDKDLGERFNSTHELSLYISKQIREKYSLSVGYTNETYNENFNPDKIGGNTLNVSFTF